MSQHPERLNFALELAAAAGQLILQHYRTDGLLVESKADQSPVTVADRGAELLIRQQLSATSQRRRLAHSPFQQAVCRIEGKAQPVVACLHPSVHGLRRRSQGTESMR